MNPAEIAGILDAIEKVAQEYRSLSAEQLRGMTHGQVMEWAGRGQPKTQVGRKIKERPSPKTSIHEGLANAPTRVSKKPEPTGVIKGMAEKAKAMSGGTGTISAPRAVTMATKVKPNRTGLAPEKLRAAMQKAKTDPGGKMHQLLAQRAKLLKKGSVVSRQTISGTKGRTPTDEKMKDLLRTRRLVVSQGGPKAHDALMKSVIEKSKKG